MRYAAANIRDDPCRSQVAGSLLLVGHSEDLGVLGLDLKRSQAGRRIEEPGLESADSPGPGIDVVFKRLGLGTIHSRRRDASVEVLESLLVPFCHGFFTSLNSCENHRSEGKTSLVREN